MKAMPICEGVYWVGAIDWNLRNFHGYETEKGSTYNAYLVIDEKIALIDTVKEGFEGEMLARIRSVIDPAKIDIIVSNHAEPDHSGCLPAVLRAAPHAKVYTAAGAGVKDLSAYYGDLGYVGVKAGETLALGKRTLTFVPTPMVHWPDNMVSFMTPDNILFSNDAFGQHYASDERLDTECDLPEAYIQARKYYANIVQPYGMQTGKALAACAGLPIQTICPSHGIVWTKHIPDILALYQSWVAGEYDDTAVIVYDTMWHSTEAMAHAIENAFLACGLRPRLYNLHYCHNSDIIADAMTAKYIAVGSPTLNNNMMPSVASFLTYFKGLTGNKKKSIAFGSYGWGGQSPDQVQEMLAACKCEALLPAIRQAFHYVVYFTLGVTLQAIYIMYGRIGTPVDGSGLRSDKQLGAIGGKAVAVEAFEGAVACGSRVEQHFHLFPCLVGVLDDLCALGVHLGVMFPIARYGDDTIYIMYTEASGYHFF